MYEAESFNLYFFKVIHESKNNAFKQGLLNLCEIKLSIKNLSFFCVVSRIEVHSLLIHAELETAVDGDLAGGLVLENDDFLHPELKVRQGLAISIVEVALND